MQNELGGNVAQRWCGVSLVSALVDPQAPLPVSTFHHSDPRQLLFVTMVHRATVLEGSTQSMCLW